MVGFLKNKLLDFFEFKFAMILFGLQVPIGGCYRLIDIPMSNCINSGIKKIFILTQFNSFSLNRHLARTYNFGNGINFGDGFVEVSPCSLVILGEIFEIMVYY